MIEPYEHQQECLDRMRGQDAFALLLAMRTGKSAITLWDWDLSGRQGNLLIIAPAGSYRGWLAEIDKVLDPKPLVGLWDSRQGMRSIEHLFKSSGRKILIVNVEAYSTIDVVRHASATILQEYPKSTLVVDESVTIKNYFEPGKGSARGQTVHILRTMAGRARILTGLPTPRSPLDLWGQFEFLKPGLLGFVSYKAFEDRYAVVKHIRVGGRHSIRVPVRYRPEIDELWKKLEPWSFRRRLEDCVDVPEKLYVTREVELTPIQRSLYDQMQRTATAELESGVVMSSQQTVTTALRLHQICCGWLTDENNQAHAIDENRTKALVDLVRDVDGKAVVWCSYARDLQKVADALRAEFGPESVAMFWGGNRAEREEESDRFKTDAACVFMVATPAAGGRGRDWSEASTIVYFSNTDNLEHRDQSEERASGLRKRDRVTVVDFVTRGTVERKIIEALRRKIDLAAVVLSDPDREWVI